MKISHNADSFKEPGSRKSQGAFNHGTGRSVQVNFDYKEIFQLYVDKNQPEKRPSLQTEIRLNKIFLRLKNDFDLTKHKHFAFVKDVGCQ